MKIKNTHLKKALALCAIILTTVCHITTKTAYAWDDDSDTPFSETTIVRFGLINKETGEMEYSQPDYFFDHYKYGLAHSLYNAVYYQWRDNANMCPDVGQFWDELYEMLGSEFFSVLSSQRYLMNVAFDTRGGQVYVMLNRTPGGSDYPYFNIESTAENKYLFEIGPIGYKSSAWVFTKSGNNGAYRAFLSFAPYVNRTLTEITDHDTTLLSSYNSVSTLEELIIRLSQPNTRSAFFVFRITIPAMHLYANTGSEFMYTSYTNAVSPQGFSYNMGGYANDIKVVMADYPIYENFESNFQNPNIYPNTTSGKTNVIFNISRIYERFMRDVPPFKISSQTPIWITGYDEIPTISPTPTPSVTITATPALATATPTPTALPTITLAPSPTPSGVSPIEGVETMFSLFTRRYDINIMGVTVGIRPFFLFVGCFVVGSVITMIQGGNKS